MGNGLVVSRPRTAALFSMLGMLATMGVVFAADRPAAPDRAADAALQIGRPAPDFELPLLKPETNDKGEKVWRITDEKVKLSSFRGKKVVCVFMSSYT